MKLAALIGVTAISIVGVGTNASAEPDDGSGNKVVEEYSEPGTIWCDDTMVSYVWHEWSQMMTSEQQDLMLVHATRTYTVAGEDRPFFRFVSSFVDRSFDGATGDRMSARAGLDDAFIGHTLVNELTGDVTRSGQETLSPDEQACTALAG